MKYPLVYIEWSDAIDGAMEWVNIKSAKKWAKNEDWIIRQVGFVLKENKKYILLCSKLNLHEDEPGMVNFLTKIPKTWILKRKKIKL